MSGLSAAPRAGADDRDRPSAAIGFIGRRFWRTLRARTAGEAQQALGHFAAGTSDQRRRRGSTVGELGNLEPLRPLPALAFPAEIVVERQVSRSALVAFEGNRYSVPPAHAGRRIEVRARVGEPVLSVFSPAGSLVATHRRAPLGAGQTVRTAEHAGLLEQAVLGAFTTQTECRGKVNRPPGETALAELARLRGLDDQAAPVISLERYAALAEVAC